MPEISIGKLRGGLCVYWADEDGKRRRIQLKARTRAEAEAEAIEVFKRETYRSRPTGQTVAQMWEAYVDDLGDKPTAKTMKYTGKAVLPHFGAFLPENITKALCQDYSKRRYDQGKSQGTVWTELGHLQSTLKHAKKTGSLQGDVPHIWRPVKPETDKRILNPGEIRAVIDGAHDPHIRLALVLLFGTAARISAILDLTWDRVDFNAGTINLRLPDNKTRKGRAIVPMNATTRSALSAAREAALSEYVIEYAGGPIKSARNGITNAVERAGIGHVRIHDFRHTAAVHMLGAGIPIEKVAQVLGHSNTAITYKTYGRYLPEHMQDAVDVLDFMSLKRRS